MDEDLPDKLMDLPDELIELLELLQEGALDEAGRKRLHSMLEGRPDLLRMVADHFAVSRALAHCEVCDTDFAERTAAHVAKLANEGEFAFVGQVKRRVIKRRVVKSLAIAAVLMLAAVPMALKPPVPTGSGSVARVQVATMTKLGKDGVALGSTAVHEGSRIEEKSGLMRLEFTNGAVVAVEAPVAFEVVSAMEIVLESGRLNAWCPEDAHGFQVRTASASLKDLGTSFGVSTTADGRSEFVVLDGAVEVKKGSEKLLLEKGEAVTSSKKEEALKPVDFEPLEFKKTWALASGIIATKGAVVPADPDVPEKVAVMESDDHVLVIPEKRGVIFNRPIAVEVTGPGDLPGTFDRTPETILPVPEKRLRSVILRFDPKGTWPPDHFLPFEGEVTFDSPVVGISCLRDTLEKSDELFATVSWSSRFRGIELDQGRNPPDYVQLSKDRRTVKIVFFAGASTDEVRVIMEDN
ncbi:FecR domain-containing protein [Haloferula sp. BvORR071]|uniref:FecR domain-containing protein n=1 Tax=Haloferula sp. BvORR071 TaxID=1396141 RepID=UPI0022410540|nr:FecR domain-containing protein [Haloferula sp. BvORR071]